MFPDGRVFGAKFRRGYELFVLAEERKAKEKTQIFGIVEMKELSFPWN